jgi:hypothetical protein
MAQNSLCLKSSKAEFKSVYGLTVLGNLGGLHWLHTEDGAQLLKLTSSVAYAYFHGFTT